MVNEKVAAGMEAGMAAAMAFNPWSWSPSASPQARANSLLAMTSAAARPVRRRVKANAKRLTAAKK